MEKRKIMCRMPAVVKKIGLSRSTIYGRLNPRSPSYDATFPRPINLGGAAIAFFEEDLDAWLMSKLDSKFSIGEEC
jgi:prophage regulatory protein